MSKLHDAMKELFDARAEQRKVAAELKDINGYITDLERTLLTELEALGVDKTPSKVWVPFPLR